MSGDCLEEIDTVNEMQEDSGNKVTLCHSQAELEIASSLASDVIVEPTYYGINDSVIFPRGGRTSDEIWLENTCPVDNWMMIFQAMVRFKKLNLEELNAAGQVIESALNQNRYADVKVEILPYMPNVVSNIMNFYAGEDELFLKHLMPFMKSSLTTTCNSKSCPDPASFIISSHVTLAYPTEHTVECNLVLDALNVWIQPHDSRCSRKFPHQSTQDILHFKS